MQSVQMNFFRCLGICSSKYHSHSLKKYLIQLILMEEVRFHSLNLSQISKWFVKEMSKNWSEKSIKNEMKIKKLTRIHQQSLNSNTKESNLKQGSTYCMLKRNNYSVNWTLKWEFSKIVSHHSTSYNHSTTRLINNSMI